MMQHKKPLHTTFISTLCAIFFTGCALRPAAWTPPSKPEFRGSLSLNSELKSASKIDLLGYYGAEEFAIDEKGIIYCGVHKGKKDFSFGAILKISPDDSVKEFLVTKNWVTGMQFNREGDLIALMNNVGLIRINKDQTIDTLLTKTPDGLPILMGTGLKIDSSGTIYFVNTSSEHATSPKYINRLILEMKPTGGIYSYQPKTKTYRMISQGNYFGNGLEISPEEDFILVSETSRYRILKYWIKGEKKGSSEIFMDNLPGFPNNISKSKNGHFWIGFTTKRNDQLDKIHPKTGVKRIVYGLPSFIQPKPDQFGMVMKVSKDGEILQALFDPDGKVVTEAGAVAEYRQHLFLGGDVVSSISKYKLD